MKLGSINIQPVVYFWHDSFQRSSGDFFDLFNRHALINNSVVNQGDIIVIVGYINNLLILTRWIYMLANVPVGQVIFVHGHPRIPPYITVIIKITGVQTDAGLPHNIRRHRCPSRITTTRTPKYPSRRPGSSRHPNPAIPVIPSPASIMKRRPTPRLIGNPKPAIIIRMCPVSIGVGAPVPCHIAWIPNLPVSSVINPVSVRCQSILKNTDLNMVTGISLNLMRRNNAGKQQHDN